MQNAALFDTLSIGREVDVHTSPMPTQKEEPAEIVSDINNFNVTYDQIDDAMIFEV